MFLEKKAHIFGNKTVDQHSGANLKKLIFVKFCVWSAQHPNAGQNIQQLWYGVFEN